MWTQYDDKNMVGAGRKKESELTDADLRGSERLF